MIIGEKQDELIDVFTRIASNKNSDLTFSEDQYEIMSFDLDGRKRNLVYKAKENNSRGFHV